MKATTLKILVLSLALTGVMWAADEDEDPGQGVARVSLINGDVSVRRGDSGEVVAAAVNAPLVVQDQVITGSASRAEVQFDWANMIRLSSNSEIRLADLENRRYLIQVAQGTVTFRVARESDADVEISTPNVSVRPMRKGSYRITVQEDGDSEITVRSGEAEIFTPGGSERLGSGRTMLARGSASDPEYRIVSGIGKDGWDQWNEERDRRFEDAQAYRYVDRSIYGAEDLEGYGSWVDVAPYGWVWSPRVAAGWAPYSYGRWAWMDWYGWNWVSYDPWGWAPFHYGRWFYDSPRGWCWYPGPLRTRQYWRPGLVAFFGYGGWGGFQAGAGLGHVGWVPLAPHEPFHPWYGRRYYNGYRNDIDNSVRIVNNTNIVSVYRNARVNNAVSAMEASQFGRGSGNPVRVRGDELRRVDLVRGQLPVVPGRESLRVSNRQVVTTPERRVIPNERFFSRTRPAPVDRVPFEQQQRGIEQVTRRTFGEPAPVRRVEPAAPAPSVQAPTVRPVPVPERRQPVDNDNWRRFERTAPRAEPAAPSRTMDAPRREPPVYRPAPAETPRQEAPVYRPVPRNNDEPRNNSPQIRVSPPTVRERQAAPAPRTESARPAPQVREAPRGGDGGTASRSEGGARGSAERGSARR